MFYVTKGLIQLQVSFNGALAITPVVRDKRFNANARVIANSHKAILEFELKDISSFEKEKSIKDYFLRNGWEVHNNDVQNYLPI